MNLMKGFRSRVAAGFAVARQATAKKASDPNAHLTGTAGWRSMGGCGYGQYYSGSEVNWEKKAGHVLENGVVAICMAYVMKKIVEARDSIVTETDKGKDDESIFRNHPLLDLLSKPNGEYTGNALRQANAVSYLIAGECFMVKADRVGKHGPPRELWHIPYFEMEPLPPKDGRGPTEVYKRSVPGGGSEYYHREDVIHIKFGMDPRNPRRGWSPFRAMFAEVVSDREIATFTATVLRNLGVMGYIITPGEGESFEDTDQIKEKFRSSMTGDNRAEPVVSNVPINVNRVGYSPQEMAIGSMADRPEARVCASFGLNTMAVGLLSGEASKKYSNYKEARAATWEDCLIPLLSQLEDAVNAELAYEFSLSENESFRFNLDKVRDLQPDLNATHDRWRKNWIAGITKLSETRKAVGATVEDSDLDGFLWQLNPKKQSSGGSGTADDTENPDDENDPRKEPDAK